MMTAPQISERDTGDRLRLEWDNKKMPKNQLVFWFLILFWIVWAPLTCWATTMIFTSDVPIFFCIWCVFGWAGTVLIPLTLARRGWREWVEVDTETISWGAQGIWAPKPKSISLRSVEEVGWGRLSDGDETEGMISLSIFEKPKRWRGRSRHVLAYWLTKDYKRQIFEAIRWHAESQGIPLAFKTYDV